MSAFWACEDNFCHAGTFKRTGVFLGAHWYSRCYFLAHEGTFGRPLELIGLFGYLLAQSVTFWRMWVLCGKCRYFLACTDTFRCAQVLLSMQDILMRHDDDDDDDYDEDDNSV